MRTIHPTLLDKILASLALSLVLACGGSRGAGNVENPSGGTSGGTPPTPALTLVAGSPLVSGSSDGSGAVALFNRPIGTTVDASGNIYVGDWGNHTIRKISSSGTVMTLAGFAGQSGFADGAGSAARFNEPTGLAVDSAGNIFVADLGNNAIRKITPNGTVSTVAGGSWGHADGTGAMAQFNSPYSLAVDSSDNLYVTDNGNCTIRKITPSGNVATLAGAGMPGSADGNGVSASFSFPAGIALDASGNLLVADMGNNTIRKVSPAGTVTTVAGMAGIQGSSDGVGSSARFNSPWGVGVDKSGNVFVADMGNSTLRRITTTEGVTTVVGVAGNSVVTPGALPGSLASPEGLALAPDGSLVIVSGDAVLRAVLP